jgi:hypothetical protein
MADQAQDISIHAQHDHSNASQRRAALRAIASNTRVMSDEEPLIMRRMSLVPACCWRASASSRSSS